MKNAESVGNAWVLAGLKYSDLQGHGLHHQTCLAHLDRKARFVEQHGSDLIGMRLKLWFDRAFGLSRDIATLAASTVKN